MYILLLLLPTLLSFSFSSSSSASLSLRPLLFSPLSSSTVSSSSTFSSSSTHSYHASAMSSSFTTFLFPLPLFFLLRSSCNLEFLLVHSLISLLLLLLLVFFTIVFHLLLLFLLLLPVSPPVAPHPSQSFLDSTSPSSASATNPIVVESNRYRPMCFYCCFSLLLSHHFNRHSNLSGFTGAMNFSDFNTIGVTAIPLLIIPNIINIQQATDNVVDND